jgi:hypothetical protein
MNNDSFTEVTHQSWFQRIGSAIKGIFVGIILFIAGFPLLFWNEGRSVKTHRALEEGEKAVVSSEPSRVDPALDKKLVHFVGTTSTSDILSDPEFGISVTAVKMERLVEMYQWEEEEKTTTKKKLGGGQERRTEYSYHKVWSSEVIDSSGFAKSGHSNPGSMQYETRNFTANTVELGAFTLSKSLIAKMTDFEPYDLTEESYSGLPEPIKNGFVLYQKVLYAGANPATPEIGDLRVSFRVVKPGGTISLVAKQRGSSFEPYIASNGREIELLKSGDHSAEAMFQAAKQENAVLTWILRFVGFFIMFVGLSMIFKPISVLGDVVPFIGDLLGMGIALVAGVIAFCCALITIAIAWIFYRPILGIGLLIVAVAIFVALKKRGKKLAELKTSSESPSPEQA